MSLFSDRLNQAMQEKGYTLGMLEVRTGITRPEICRYKSGKREPNAYNLMLLANTLDVDPNWLIGYEKGIKK